jgi:CheY-like chemotaxis protein
VTLSVARGQGVAEVRVRDTGVGIEPALQEVIFDPFIQAKQSLARTEGGLGLGLALVKRLVELHGGTVTATSAGRDRGAEFRVTLPLLSPEPARQDLAGDRDGRRSQARLRVLVVDDNHDAAESMAELVTLLGHEAEVAFDGWSAVRSVTARPPDIVLCDIGLPGLSGYQVAEALRADHRFDAVQLIAVTGYAQPEDRKRAQEAGFADHIAKPPDPAKVIRLLTGTPTRGR